MEGREERGRTCVETYSQKASGFKPITALIQSSFTRQPPFYKPSRLAHLLTSLSHMHTHTWLAMFNPSYRWEIYSSSSMNARMCDGRECIIYMCGEAPRLQDIAYGDLKFTPPPHQHTHTNTYTLRVSQCSSPIFYASLEPCKKLKRAISIAVRQRKRSLAISLYK